MNKNEKFKIDRDKLEKIVQEYQQKLIKFKNMPEEELLTNEYINKIIHIWGNENLLKAIDLDVLKYYASNMLNKEKIHYYYEDLQTLDMIEGLSNKEVVGDWQHFWTIKSEFIFELPQEQQEKIAENFAVGNSSAQKCLVELWKKHIKTTGTDVIRAESPGSTNNITISTSKEKMPILIESLAKNLQSKDTFLGIYSCNKQNREKIIMHSMNDDFFDNVQAAVQKLNKEELYDDSIKVKKDNYWSKAKDEASKYGVDVIHYLDVNNIDKYIERKKEQIYLTQKSSNLSRQQTIGIMNRIKNIPRNLFQSVSDFMR